MSGGIYQKHGIGARYEFIEFCLCWHGRINRSDLVDVFSISGSQASADLQNYAKSAPQNLRYDTGAKTYRRAEHFVPAFSNQTADSYLASLLAIDAGILAPSAAWLRHIPPFYVTPTPARGVQPKTLRQVVNAVDSRLAIEILYQSMSSADPAWRWIEPHAYAFDGFRWHIRAFCLRDRMFKDFLLSRVLSIKDYGNLRSAVSTGRDDLEWISYVQIRIAPHPSLSISQQAAIRLDYGMEEHGWAEINVRRSMLFYTLKRLGLDIDPSVRNPQDQQIILINRDEVLGARPAKEFS